MVVNKRNQTPRYTDCFFRIFIASFYMQVPRLQWPNIRTFVAAFILR